MLKGNTFFHSASGIRKAKGWHLTEVSQDMHF